MGKSQRNKGAGYEREVCEVFSAALGSSFKRNIGQARDGGNDINVGPLVVECKRRKTLGTVEGWLLQAAAACDNSSQYPIVVARSDGGKSMVIMDLDHFLELACEGLCEEIEGTKPVDKFMKQMTPDKKARLIAAGWQTGSTADFLYSLKGGE